MAKVLLTSAPGTTVKTLTIKGNKIADMVKACKGEWQAIQAAANDSKNALSMAFAEVEVSKKYDDELSGELTAELDKLFAPKVAPVVVQKPKPNAKPSATRKPRPAGKLPNKAARVRSMVSDNPNADAAQLMVMVADSDIGIPKGKIKDYVIGSIKTIRG